MNNKRILVGMSGGIDSSATCIMLQRQGYEVVGITMRTYDLPTHFSSPGQELPDEILKAQALAGKLGIEHHIADVRTDFKNIIIRYFIDEYMHGRTPNPCVMCNPLFKERILCEWADRTNCAQFATGHYCRLENRNGYFYLTAGDDTAKDQSYFLWKLPQEILKRMVFPLGGMTKAQVREYLIQQGFEAKARENESMEICFIDTFLNDALLSQILSHACHLSDFSASWARMYSAAEIMSCAYLQSRAFLPFGLSNPHLPSFCIR